MKDESAVKIKVGDRVVLFNNHTVRGKVVEIYSAAETAKILLDKPWNNLYGNKLQYQFEDLDNLVKEEDKNMDKDALITALYTHRVLNTIREKYREAMKEEDELVRKHDELWKFLESDEGCELSWREHTELSSELSELRRKRDEAKVARNVWDQARDICMDIADELVKED